MADNLTSIEEANLQSPERPTRSRSRVWGIILWLLVAASVWVIVVHYHDIKNVVNILLNGRWQYIVLAVVLQIISYVFYAITYQKSFRAVGITSSIWSNLTLYLESLLFSIIVPAGNVSFFLGWVKRSNQQTSSGAVALILVRIADLLSFFLLFLLGFFYLSFQNKLQHFEIIIADILFILSLGSVGLLVLGAVKPQILGFFLRAFSSIVNFFSNSFSGKDALHIDWAVQISRQISIDARELLFNWRSTIGVTAWTFTTHLLDLITVFALFLAFRASIGLGTLLVGFVIGLFFAIVPITPQGIGAVEGAMILAYTGLGVTGGLATVVTLAFRGLSFWLPAIIGLLLLQGRTLSRMVSNSVGRRNLFHE